MSDSPGLEESMSHKLGPLPVGVWLLAIGGGVAIAIYYRRNAAATTATTDPVASTDTQPGAGNLSDGTDPNTPTGPQRPSTNEEWYSASVDAILGTNRGYNPGAVETALRRYLDGQTLNASDQAIVNTAIRLVGAPPSPPPAPDPGTEPGNPPDKLAAPTNVRATSVGKTTATVAWNAVAGAQSYLVSVSNGHSYNVTGTTDSLSGLKTKTHYTVNVQAIAGGKAGPRGKPASFTTGKAVKASAVMATEAAPAPVTGTPAPVATPAPATSAVQPAPATVAAHPVRHDVMPQQRAHHL